MDIHLTFAASLTGSGSGKTIFNSFFALSVIRSDLDRWAISASSKSTAVRSFDNRLFSGEIPFKVAVTPVFSQTYPVIIGNEPIVSKMNPNAEPSPFFLERLARFGLLIPLFNELNIFLYLLRRSQPRASRTGIASNFRFCRSYHLFSE